MDERVVHPDAEGRFVRGETAFRRRITADGSSGFPAEAGRYHLYVAYAYPWAHRTLIARALLGLEDAISISVVNPFMGDDGWTFPEYTPINNGVYRAGFAVSQAAYEEAVTELFDALARWEEVLSTRRYLCGPELTEADVCLFTTLYRFDPVYHGHFKCNVKRIQDYPNLWGFMRDVYQIPGVAATCRLDHVKEHYYRSHPNINPTRIVPVGPSIDYTTPHGRDVRFGRFRA